MNDDRLLTPGIDTPIDEPSHKQLKEALAEARMHLKNIFQLMDTGYFVRDVSRDHEPDWAIRQMEPMMHLSRAVRFVDDIQAILSGKEGDK